MATRVEQEPGWRVEWTAKGPTAYAPDRGPIVQLRDVEADYKWRKNTLSELRKAGLDLYEEFRSNSTAPKRVRRERAQRPSAPRSVAHVPQPMPAPTVLPASVDTWRLSTHAREQAEARDVPLQEVYAAATLPTATRDADNESGRKIYQRGDLALIVAEETKTIITVLPPGRATAQDVAELVEASGTPEAKASPELVVDLRTTPSVVFEPPADAAAVARRLSDEFLLCREVGHPWRPWQAYWDEEKRRFERAFKCPRCKSSKWQRLSKTGANLGTTYHHADGYLIEGVGRIVGTARDSLRLESVMRMVDGSMRGMDRKPA